MKGLKKIIGMMLIAGAMLPVLVLRASAVGMSVAGYAEDQNMVLINITTEPAAQTDFVTEFPKDIAQNAAIKSQNRENLALQERQEYVSIPLYYQNDYPDTMYGSGTVETSGCSITSIAMVASYMTGYEYLPDELAYYFGGRAPNNIERLECAAQTLGIPYEKPENWHYTLAELKAGKIAIVLLGANSPFTDAQHFIVLTGMTEDGKILVNDPSMPNYERWDLKEGFATGFTESEICAGYQGAWVFDKATMPEEIDRYFEGIPNPEAARYPELELSVTERQLLARVVWVEARGESLDGQQAVAEVVLNRLMSDNFPDNLRDVIYGEGQFRSVEFLDDAEPGQTQYQAVERALYGPYLLPEDVVYFATYPTNDKEWGTIGGHIFCYENDKNFAESMG